jgi:hypothetical protein
MPYWGWLVVGIVLLGSELLLVDADFYLVFLGIAAIAVGLVDMAGVEVPLWSEWLAFGVLSVVSMVFFRKRVYERLRGNLPDSSGSLVGEWVDVENEIAPGRSGRGSLRGTTWTVANEGDRPLVPGERARVVRAEGVTLYVNPAVPG